LETTAALIDIELKESNIKRSISNIHTIMTQASSVYG
jgi:hypothetical protein